MKTSSSLSRRSFLKRSAATGAALSVPMIVPGGVLGKDAMAPSERITLGVIGFGGRCGRILPHFMMFDDVQCIGVSECRADRMAKAKKVIDDHNKNQDCATYTEFRDLLARDDLDAVLIATGDRWHTPASVLAAKAGKDIYCEKPVSLAIAESRALADTIARYGTVYQAGHQRRSVSEYRFQAEAVRKGLIGKVHTVICQVWAGPTVAYDKPQPVPKGFDYDRWLGPTPWHPYSAARVNGWNYFWDTGAGPIIGMGCHYTDLVQWVMDRDDTGPTDYQGTATWDPKAFSDTPVTADCTCTYADGLKIVLKSSGSFADRYIRFVGSEGWVQVDDGTNLVTAEPKSILKSNVRSTMGYAATGDHVRNWLDCIKSRRSPIAHAESAHRANTICNIANIGLRLGGRSLKWDPVTERFANDDQANSMLQRAMRQPWRV